MDDLNQAYEALKKADAAGDSAGAKQLADYIRGEQGKASQQVSGPAPATTDAIPNAAKEQSAVPFMADKFKQGAANLLGLANAPVSIAGAALEAVGVVKKGETFGGTAMATRGWEGLLGVEKIKQPKDVYGGESKTNEYLGTIAEFLGGSLFPGAGIVANASRKLATAVTVALGTTESAMYSVKGKEVGGLLAPSLGLTKEQGEEIGQGLGSLAGPGLTGLASQKLLKGINSGGTALAKADITGTSKEAQAAAANSLLNKDIENSLILAPNSEANIARAIALKKKADGFSPNIAQMSDAPGLVAMYKEVANKSPEALAKASAMEQRNLTAVAAYRDKTFPVGTQSVTDPARIKLSSDRAVSTMAIDKTGRDLNALSSKFARTVDNEAVGAELRNLYWGKRAEAKQVVDTELAGVYATAKKVGIREDMTDVRDSIKKIVNADRTTFQDMPPTFAKVMQEYPEGKAAVMSREATMPQGAVAPIYKQKTTAAIPGKSEASFEEVHSLYKQANKDWADATAAGNSTKAFYMKAVKEQLQAKVAKYNGPEYGEMAQKFGDYNKNYAKYATTFREGAGGEIAKRTKAGIATDAEDIVSKVILQTGDKKKGVQDFFQVYGSDEKAAQLLHDGLLDNFSKAAMKSGTLNPKAAQAWLTKNQSALGELPELTKALGNSTKMAQDLVDRKLMLQKQRQVLDRTVLAKAAKSDKPEQIVMQAVQDPKMMKALLVGAITPSSKDAIARSIADVVARQPNSFDFLLKNEKSLKPVMDQLGKGHWGNLKDIAEMEKISDRVKAPTQVELTKLQDVGEKVIGTSVKGMFSRLRNLDKPMGVSKEYLVLDIGGRFFYKTRSEELARLRETAMFDTDVAELLSKLGKKSSYTKKDLLDLQAMSYSAGSNSVAQEVGREEERKAEKQR